LIFINMSLQAIVYTRGSLSLLDQRLLPFESKYIPILTPEDAWNAIKDMVVRGAPAIGVTGALALAVNLVTEKKGGEEFSSIDEAKQHIRQTMDYLVTSRPTAVNLKEACDRIKHLAKVSTSSSASELTATIVSACEAFLQEDIDANKALSAFGADALFAAADERASGAVSTSGESRRRRRVSGAPLRVLTHCNTGSLATAGWGTALGCIRELHRRGLLEHAYCTETRPYNQGARLTAFELVYDNLRPHTLICDSAASALMSKGLVDAVVVGADRVVANGDTANKIGTYSLAIAAKRHGIPFFVAAPTTTLDENLKDGEEIEIEQRPSEEITHFRNSIRVAAEGIEIWNPCFDVTPADLIEGIITEKGMVPVVVDTPQQTKVFEVKKFLDSVGMSHDAAQEKGKDEKEVKVAEAASPTEVVVSA